MMMMKTTAGHAGWLDGWPDTVGWLAHRPARLFYAIMIRMISACVPEIATLYLGTCIHFVILLYTNAEFSNVLCAYICIFFYKCLWPWNLPNYICPVELEI